VARVCAGAQKRGAWVALAECEAGGWFVGVEGVRAAACARGVCCVVLFVSLWLLCARVASGVSGCERWRRGAHCARSLGLLQVRRNAAPLRSLQRYGVLLLTRRAPAAQQQAPPARAEPPPAGAARAVRRQKKRLAGRRAGPQAAWRRKLRLRSWRAPRPTPGAHPVWGRAACLRAARGPQACSALAARLSAPAATPPRARSQDTNAARRRCAGWRVAPPAG
jgi:hypothetical protein